MSAKVKHFRRVYKRETERGSLVEFESRFEATDWIAFHDDAASGGDGDGAVSLEEFASSVTELVEQWILAREQGAVDEEEEEDGDQPEGSGHGEF